MGERAGKSRWKVLLVDDEVNALEVYGALIEREGYGVLQAQTGAEALAAAEGEEMLGLALLDLRLPDVEGLDLFRRLRDRRPDVPVMILTGYGSIESAVLAVKEGAFHYLAKPPETEQLLSLIRSAVHRRALEEENARLRLRLREEEEEEMVGRSKPMLDLFGQIRSVGPTRASVLITGESGTGKELVARALHRRSAVREGPFVSVNCGALPPNLLESELFGYEKGAFTGAAVSKPGLFELADGGTIFLDEVGECSSELQVRLLRVLQEKELRRVGGTKSVFSDFRLVSATNSPLEEQIGEGRFREDLYYRINVINLPVPPLRERREDVPLLAAAFLEKTAGREGCAVSGFSGEALELLVSYRWPGNVRELENVVERGVVVTGGETIEVRDLPPHLRSGGQASAGGEDLLSGDMSLAEVEKRMMEATLGRHGGNKSQAARVLGVSRKLLYSKIREYGL